MKKLDGVESLTPNGGEEKALCRDGNRGSLLQCLTNPYTVPSRERPHFPRLFYRALAQEPSKRIAAIPVQRSIT